MKVDNLSRFELHTLSRFLLHHMRMETRGKLIEEFPVIYRKLLGKEDSEEFRRAVKNVVLDREWTPKALDALSDDIKAKAALDDLMSTLEEDE